MVVRGLVTDIFFKSYHYKSAQEKSIMSLKLLHCAPHCQVRDEKKVVYIQFSERPFDELYRALKRVAAYRKGPDVGTGYQSGWHVPFENVKALINEVKPLWKKLASSLMKARDIIKHDPGGIPCPGQKRGRLIVVKD